MRGSSGAARVAAARNKLESKWMLLRRRNNFDVRSMRGSQGTYVAPPSGSGWVHLYSKPGEVAIQQNIYLHLNRERTLCPSQGSF
jgi:hypothetical protein